jgi:hypothetical protein
MREEIGRLRNATKAATKRKTCKRRYIQTEETLTVSEVVNLVAVKEGGSCNDGEQLLKRVRVRRHCGHCGEIRHNSRTCKVEIVDTEDSDASK